MDRIFEPFHTTKEPGSGTGLGLFVVRHIVESSGGTVAASSQVGAGSSFTFSLPIDQGTDSD
jgi:signal transduction histidine kinase